GNWIVKNLLIAAAILLVVVTIASFFLSFITNHGQVIVVPDFSNMTVAEAEATAKSLDLRVEVYDSVYVRKMAKGAVFSQNPIAGQNVKQNRRILLTINAVTAKKVSMPNAVHASLRQAKAEISAKGLLIGKLIYREDEATDNVLEQLYRGRNIKPGTQIETGSTIDLVVGLSPEENLTYVPDVVGMKYRRAYDAVLDNSLNVTGLIFDKSVKTYSDSLDAVVYKQGPLASDAPILKGEGVSLYLSIDPEKIK
ncbi:MAG: PASTA domain-containing protein, partial [Bacteroidales bacterium]|nr:PASTA domain-containing protein [Bacteroidales bacterium]